MMLFSIILSFFVNAYSVNASFQQFTVLPVQSSVSNPSFITTNKANSRIISLLYFAGQHFDCNGQLPVGYSMRCLEVDDMFGTPVVQILKNNKHYAKYENVYDGAVSTDGKYIALQNATNGKNDTVTEQVRIITVSNKRFIRLPQIDCTQNIMRWSNNKLITMSEVDYEQATMCIWKHDVTLLHSISGKNANTATTSRSIDRIGILPIQSTVLYTFGHSSDHLGTSCLLYMFDTASGRENRLLITPKTIDGYMCNLIELDLSNIKLNATSVRYREYSLEGNTISNWYTTK